MVTLAVGNEVRAQPAPADRPPPTDSPTPGSAPPAPPVPQAPTPSDTAAPQAPKPAEESPWAKGVSLELREKAQRLLGEGNAKFADNQLREALATYEEAIASWEHPWIRFNMVRALIALDRPLEAQQSLEKALAYGKGPFDDALYREAQNYQRLLASQIASLEVSCKQSGVVIKVDGASWLKCPGSTSKRVLPGSHVIVASKVGFVTQAKDLVLVGGKNQSVPIELVTIANATVYRTRWKTWKPWAVAGGGVALAGLGLLVNAQASYEMDRIKGQVLDSCGPAGCTADQYRSLQYDSAESRAVTLNRVGVGMIVAGGAVVVGGVVAVILNRPRPFVPERQPPVVHAARLVPTWSPDGGGVTVLGSF